MNYFPNLSLSYLEFVRLSGVLHVKLDTINGLIIVLLDAILFYSCYRNQSISYLSPCEMLSVFRFLIAIRSDGTHERLSIPLITSGLVVTLLPVTQININDPAHYREIFSVSPSPSDHLNNRDRQNIHYSLFIAFTYLPI